MIDSSMLKDFVVDILTNKVHKKETNEKNAWQRYKVQAGFEPTTELKRILPNARLVGYFRLFIVFTGCPSKRRPQKTVSC